MNFRKTKSGVFSAALLIAAMFFAAVSPEILSAQSKRLVGELTVVKNGLPSSGTPVSDAFVTIDGVRAASGRSVMSPSDVVTPADASAKITFAQTGTVTIAPNSAMSLTFVDASISGDLANGEVVLETIPNTTLNIFTRDGAVWTPNRNEKNTVRITVKNGATRISVIDGQIMFNKVTVSAGESFPRSASGNTQDDDSDNGSGINPLLIAGIAGAVAAAVIIALTVSSSDDENPVISPTR